MGTRTQGPWHVGNVTDYENIEYVPICAPPVDEHGFHHEVAFVLAHSNYGGPYGMKPEDEANAELIVRAVNAHATLVAALERAREAVEAIVLSTHSISFDADLRAIDSALLLAKHGAAPSSTNEEAA